MGCGRAASRAVRAVAVLMRNGLEMVEAMFGILKAGAVVVPLNTSVADEAARAMIDDSGASAVIASHEHCRRLGPLRAKLPQVRTWIAVQPESSTEPWLDFAAFRDAGAAHDPEVVPDPRRSVQHHLQLWHHGPAQGHRAHARRRLDWASDLGDRAALRQLGGHAVLAGPLFEHQLGRAAVHDAGGRHHRHRAGVLAGEILFEAIERHRVTHGSFVPVQLQRLLEADRSGRDLSSLQALMCCGSPLPVAIKRAIPQELRCELIELYGLTEGLVTTLDPEDGSNARSSRWAGRCRASDIRSWSATTIDRTAGGRGRRDRRARGRVAMAGYHNRADANAESTWVDARGRRWLRTGDIGRLDEEGFLYLVDRKKDMILSGGQNVYPADLEAVLLQHPQVAEVAVIGIPSARWGETPLALVVPRQAAAGGALNAAAIGAGAGGSDARRRTARLGQRAPRASSSGSRRLRFIESLPRNPNGKILKRELRKEYPAVP